MSALTSLCCRLGYPEPPPPFSPPPPGPPPPFVDLALLTWVLLTPNDTNSVDGASPPASSPLQKSAYQDEFMQILTWGAALVQKGLQVQTRVLGLKFANTVLDEKKRLDPVIVYQIVLSVDLGSGETSTTVGAAEQGRASMTPVQASGLEGALASYLNGWAASYVAVTRINSSEIEHLYFSPAAAPSSSGPQPPSSSLALVEIEVAVFQCPKPDPNTAGAGPPPNCEEVVARTALQNFFTSDEAATLGAHNGSIAVLMSPPPPPPPGMPPPIPATPSAWAPWHLDMLDHRESLPPPPPSPDRTWLATAKGSGVSVYLVSSGIQADHKEFEYVDGAPGSRVKPMWGFNGLPPDEDCADGDAWYAFGTYAASLIAGQTVGVAKNATLYSGEQEVFIWLHLKQGSKNYLCFI